MESNRSNIFSHEKSTNRPPFVVPDRYFEFFEEKIQNQIDKNSYSPKSIRLEPKRLLAYAASVTLLLALGFSLLTYQFQKSPYALSEADYNSFFDLQPYYLSESLLFDETADTSSIVDDYILDYSGNSNFDDQDDFSPDTDAAKK